MGVLRSDQLGRLQRLGDELRRLGYYRHQIQEIIADLLGPRNIEEMDPEEGEELLLRLQERVALVARDRKQ